MTVAVHAPDFSDHLPPQNLDAERSVLGCMLLDNDTIDEVAEFLQTSHFYSGSHQRIYAAILHLYEKGTRGIDAVTLGEELVKRNEIDDIGGVPMLA